MRFNSSKVKKANSTSTTWNPIIPAYNLQQSHNMHIETQLSKLNVNEFIRLEAMTRLADNVFSNNFVILKKACEFAHVTNQEIYDSSFTMVSNQKSSCPDLAIYFDMIYVIGEKAKKDISIAAYVLWLNDLERGVPKVPKNFQDYLSTLTDGRIQNALMESAQGTKMQRILGDREELFYGKTDRGLDLFAFNDGESVLRSTQYARYLERRYEELALYVETLVNHHVDKNTVFEEMLQCFSEGKHSLARHVSAGLNAVSDLKDFRLGGENEEYAVTASDIKELVKGWMCGFVIQEMQKYENEYHEPISKLYLARKMVPAPEKVYSDVSFLYERLRVQKKANELIDMQYHNFSWDSVIKGSEAQRHQETIDELRCALDTCQKKLKTANESLGMYKERLVRLQQREISSASSAEWGRLERKYENMLTEKDDEIERLQNELNSRERYIEIISSPVSAKKDNQKEEQTVNADILYANKYLFVGVIHDEYIDLKRKFPNSIFMETAQYNLSNIKVDMIVYLIPSMSHAMYYKVQNTNVLKDIRRVYCNKRSANSVLIDVYTALMNT